MPFPERPHMKMPGGRSRYLSIALLLVLLALVAYEYGIRSIQSELGSLEESRRAKARTLEKYMALIARKPHLEKDLAALREIRQQDEAKVIRGKSASLAAAQLQQIIKAVIGGKGGQITTERIEPLEDYSAFKIVTISVDAVFPDAGAMADSLFALETRMPYMVVRELDAKVRNHREPREILAKMKISTLAVSGIAAGKQP